jgi:hypothetical protein
MCFVLAMIGVIIVTVAAQRGQVTNDQPDWGNYKRLPPKARLREPRKSILLGVVIFVTSLTALGCAVMLVISSR